MKRCRFGSALFILFSLLWCWSSAPPVAEACSCVQPGTPAEHLERADAVFSGTVRDVKQNAMGYITKRVLFDVDATWKGIDDTQVVILTGGGGGDCGIDFKEGKRYVVYANHSKMYGDEERLTSILCDRTATTASAGEDLEYLGEGRPPTNKVDLAGDGPRLLLFWGAGIAVGTVATYLVWKRRKAEN